MLDRSMGIPLKPMFDEKTEEGFRQTPDGMAYWAGTGPAGRYCRQCQHYTDEGTYRSGKRAGGQKPGRCRQFSIMMKGKRGAKFSPSTRACRYFGEGDAG